MNFLKLKFIIFPHFKILMKKGPNNVLGLETYVHPDVTTLQWILNV